MMKLQNAGLKGLTSALALATAAASQAIDIQASYSSYFNTHATAKAAIQSAVDFLNTSYTGTTQVRIGFDNDPSVLGESSTFGLNVSYPAYLAALTAGSSGGARDVAALAQIAAHPYGGNQIHVTTALARHLGLYDFSGTFDSTIKLGIDQMFLNHGSPQAGLYDIRAVVQHEVDEVLGTASGVGSPDPNAADLFRYEAPNVRNFDTNTGKHVFFSINGTTNLVEYNHFGRFTGDWGDFANQTPPQVQDAFGAPGQAVEYGANEYGLLDVVGWNVAPVPEPATMAALGFGALAMLRRRKKSA